MPPYKGKTVQKIDDFPKCPLALRGTRAVSDGFCTTYNAACGIETHFPYGRFRVF